MRRAENLIRLCADCLEIWEPNCPGKLSACPGIQWDCFNFTITKTDRTNSDFHPCMAVLRFGLRLHCYSIYLEICLRKEGVTVFGG